MSNTDISPAKGQEQNTNTVQTEIVDVNLQISTNDSNIQKQLQEETERYMKEKAMKDQQLLEKDQLIQVKDQQIQVRDQQLVEKDQQIEELKRKLTSLEKFLRDTSTSKESVISTIFI